MAAGDFGYAKVVQGDRLSTVRFDIAAGTRIRLGAAEIPDPNGSGSIVGVPVEDIEILNDSTDPSEPAIFIGGYQQITISRRVIVQEAVTFDIQDLRAIVIENPAGNTASIVRVAFRLMQLCEVDEPVLSVAANLGFEDITAITAAAAAAAGVPTTF